MEDSKLITEEQAKRLAEKFGLSSGLKKFVVGKAHLKQNDCKNEWVVYLEFLEEDADKDYYDEDEFAIVTINAKSGSTRLFPTL